MLEKLSFIDLENIEGGNEWGSAVIGGLSGAAAGVKYCKTFGPYATVGCGIVGGAIGGWLSYYGS